MSVPPANLTGGKNSARKSLDVYDDGFLRVEHDNYFASCDNRIIKLPRAEFLILSLLIRTPERIVAAAALWQSLWSEEKPLNLDSLHVHVCRLRSKIAPFGFRIEVMKNVGYRMVIPVNSAPAS